jgi:hypothetical protein
MKDINIHAISEIVYDKHGVASVVHQVMAVKDNHVTEFTLEEAHNTANYIHALIKADREKNRKMCNCRQGRDPCTCRE